MNKIVKWVLIAVMLVALIAGATVLYNNLSGQYSANNLGASSSQSTTEDSADTAEDNKHKAPDFTVVDEDGNKVKLSDFRGKPVVLNFWASWCYYCKMGLPNYDKAYEEYPDVHFLMVNATDGVQETLSDAKEYLSEQDYDFDVFFDTEMEAVMAYGVNSYPITFFIDKEGNFVTYAAGMLDFPSLEMGIDLITED